MVSWPLYLYYRISIIKIKRPWDRFIFIMEVPILEKMFFVFKQGLLHFDRLVQERRNSIANTLELRLSCTNTSIWPFSMTYLGDVCCPVGSRDEARSSHCDWAGKGPLMWFTEASTVMDPLAWTLFKLLPLASLTTSSSYILYLQEKNNVCMNVEFEIKPICHARGVSRWGKIVTGWLGGQRAIDVVYWSFHCHGPVGLDIL